MYLHHAITFLVQSWEKCLKKKKIKEEEEEEKKKNKEKLAQFLIQLSF